MHVGYVVIVIFLFSRISLFAFAYVLTLLARCLIYAFALPAHPYSS